MKEVNLLEEGKANELKKASFLTACEICSVDIVEMLLPKDKASLEEGLRICARQGFCVVMSMILNYAAKQGIADIDFSTILSAAITCNRETFVGDLLKRGVDPNLDVFIQSPGGATVKVSALKAAVAVENNTLIAMLIEAGARFEDLAEYQEYKAKASPELREKFEEKEKVADFAQGKKEILKFIAKHFEESPLKKSPQKILDLVAELSEKMMLFDYCHNAAQLEKYEDLRAVVMNLPGLVEQLQISKKTVDDKMIGQIRQGGFEGLRGVIREVREMDGRNLPSRSPAVAGAAAAANFGRGGGGAGKAANP